MTLPGPALPDSTLNEIAEAGASYLERLWAFTEAEVVGQMVRDGCPRRDAEQQFKNKGLSFYARQYYADAQDALLGDPVAKEKVERVREAWGKLKRRAEMQR